MSSTAPASDPGPLDLGHLARMSCGDEALEREVLELFLKQTGGIIAALADHPAEAASLAHTIKGSARSIGAFAVADSAAALEDAARRGGDATSPLAALREAVTAARGAIEARLGRP
jgi:HPt (histidine-containing phosphotransfer) domain-containing protein